MSNQVFTGGHTTAFHDFIRAEFMMSVDEFMRHVEQGALVPVQKANEDEDGDLSAYCIYGDWAIAHPATSRPFASLRWSAGKPGDLFKDSLGNLWFRHAA